MANPSLLDAEEAELLFTEEVKVEEGVESRYWAVVENDVGAESPYLVKVEENLGIEWTD